MASWKNPPASLCGITSCRTNYPIFWRLSTFAWRYTKPTTSNSRVIRWQCGICLPRSYLILILSATRQLFPVSVLPYDKTAVTVITCIVKQCSWKTYSIDRLYDHLRRHHQQITAYTCNFKSCRRIYNVRASFFRHFKQHLNDGHRIRATVNLPLKFRRIPRKTLKHLRRAMIKNPAL